MTSLSIGHYEYVKNIDLALYLKVAIFVSTVFYEGGTVFYDLINYKKYE